MSEELMRLEYEFVNDEAYRAHREDQTVELTLNLVANGDQESGEDLVWLTIFMDHKDLNLETVSTEIPLANVKEIIEFLSKAVEEYENWDWENGREKQ